MQSGDVDKRVIRHFVARTNSKSPIDCPQFFVLSNSPPTIQYPENTPHAAFGGRRTSRYARAAYASAEAGDRAHLRALRSNVQALGALTAPRANS